DGGGTASHDAAAIEDLFPRHLLSLHLRRRVADLAAHSLADRCNAGIARRTHIATIEMEAVGIEVLRGLGVESLRLGIVLSNPDELQKARTVRIEFGPEPFDGLPIAVDDRGSRQISEIGEIGVEEVVLDAPLPGLDAAAARNPDRRARRFGGGRPRIDVAKLRGFAVVGKRPALPPRANDQLYPLARLLSHTPGGWPL